MPAQRFAAWCTRVYGIKRPLQPPRGLLFNQWHYKHAGYIIVSVCGMGFGKRSKHVACW